MSGGTIDLIEISSGDDDVPEVTIISSESDSETRVQTVYGQTRRPKQAQGTLVGTRKAVDVCPRCHRVMGRKRQRPNDPTTKVCVICLRPIDSALNINGPLPKRLKLRSFNKKIQRFENEERVRRERQLLFPSDVFSAESDGEEGEMTDDLENTYLECKDYSPTLPSLAGSPKSQCYTTGRFSSQIERDENADSRLIRQNSISCMDDVEESLPSLTGLPCGINFDNNKRSNASMESTRVPQYGSSVSTDGAPLIDNANLSVCSLKNETSETRKPSTVNRHGTSGKSESRLSPLLYSVGRVSSPELSESVPKTKSKVLKLNSSARGQPSVVMTDSDELPDLCDEFTGSESDRKAAPAKIVFHRKSCPPTFGKTSSTFSSSAPVSKRHRHFTDILVKPSEKKIKPSLSKSKERVHSKGSHGSYRIPRSRTKNKLLTIPSSSDSFSYIGKDTSTCSDCGFRPTLRSILESPRDKEGTLITLDHEEFSYMQTTSVELYSEDGDTFHLHSLALLSNYTTAHCRPPASLLGGVLHDILLKTTNVQVAVQAHSTLLHVLKVHPTMTELPFRWSDLECTIDRALKPGSHRIPCLLAVHYMVTLLQEDLLKQSLASQRQVFQSQAARWLRADRYFSRTNQIVSWLSSCLNSGEMDDSSGLMHDLHLAMPEGKKKVMEKPKLLPHLQTMLDLAVSTSAAPDDSARRLAKELSLIFRNIPNLHHRKVLFDTTVSALVRFRLAQRVLEDYCSGVTYSCLSGEVSLSDIINCYFTRQPVQSSLTPPPTPDADDNEEGGPGGEHTTESCQELCMLLCQVTESYIIVAKGRLTRTIPQRVQNPSTCLKAEDLETLSSIKPQVQRVRTWLTSLCSEITEGMEYYLKRLDCLSDLISA